MAKVSTLTDSLASHNAAIWTKTEVSAGTDITFALSQVSLKHRNADPTTYAANFGGVSYDMTNDACFVELFSHPGAPAAGSAFTFFMMDIASGLYGYAWQVTDNPLTVGAYYKNNAFGWTVQGTPLTYVNATHRWLRIRHSGSTVFWDTSATGTSWINRFSMAALSFDHTAIFPRLQAGDWNADNLNASVFDNFNIAPVTASRSARRRPTRFFNKRF